MFLRLFYHHMAGHLQGRSEFKTRLLTYLSGKIIFFIFLLLHLIICLHFLRGGGGGGITYFLFPVGFILSLRRKL